MRPLTAYTFRSWGSTLDQALEALPEHPDWSHTLYRALIDVSEALRIVLFTECDLPVAVIAFTAGVTAWRPITQWLLPGYLGPLKPEWTKRILCQIPFVTEQAWWRMPEPPPAASRIHTLAQESTYGLPCNESFRDYWRSTGLLQNIRRYRRKCASLEWGINVPGASEWVIRSSEEHWNPGQHAQLEARLVVARMLEAQDKLFSVSLSESNRFVGAAVVLRHRDDGVAWVTWRDRHPRYARLGIGTVLTANKFEHAKAIGLKSFDIGGSYEYKTRWARPMGTKAVVVTGPLLRGLWHTGVSTARSLSQRAHNLRRKLGLGRSPTDR